MIVKGQKHEDADSSGPHRSTRWLYFIDSLCYVGPSTSWPRKRFVICKLRFRSAVVVGSNAFSAMLTAFAFDAVNRSCTLSHSFLVNCRLLLGPNGLYDCPRKERFRIPVPFNSNWGTSSEAVLHLVSALFNLVFQIDPILSNNDISSLIFYITIDPLNYFSFLSYIIETAGCLLTEKVMFPFSNIIIFFLFFLPLYQTIILFRFLVFLW